MAVKAKAQRERKQYGGIVVSDMQAVARFSDVAEYCKGHDASVRNAAEHFDVPESRIREALKAQGLTRQSVTRWAQLEMGEASESEPEAVE